MKKSLCILMALLLVLSMAGCASKGAMMEDSAASDNYYYRYEDGWDSDMKAEMEEEWIEEDWAVEESAPESPEAEFTGSGSADTSNAPDATAEKIIYSAAISMESTKFDDCIATIENMISKFGGYIQSSTVDGDTRYNNDGTSTVVNRYAWYTIAVPSKSFEDFITESGSAGNVISLNRNAENITSAYTDVESRVKSLRVQEERLMSMMEQTGDLESLIALEARLAEVNYEIESFQRQLNNWDRRVAYSTIDIDIREVSVYTPTVTVTRTYGEKLTDAFSDGWRNLTRGLEDFSLWFAESIFGLIIWAAIITGGVLLIVKLRKRAVKKKLARKIAQDSFPSVEDKSES